MGALRVIAILLSSVCLAAAAEPPVEPPAAPPVAPPVAPPEETRAPPPDPSKGDRYDGRAPEPRVDSNDVILAVPRLVFLPFRGLFYAVEPPARSGTEFDQKHHVHEHILDALSTQDGLIGIRPTLTWVSSFRPSFGVHFFDEKMFGPGTKFNLDVAGGENIAHVDVHARPTYVDKRVQLLLDTSYDFRKDYLFTGIGTTAPLPVGSLGPSRYQGSLFLTDARLDIHATRVLAFSFGGWLGYERFGNGDAVSGDAPIEEIYCVRIAGRCVPGTVDEALVPGFNTGTQFARGSAAIHVDLRDNPLNPTLGMLFDLESDYTHGLGDDPSNYFRVRGAISFAVGLWSRTHVLILKAVSELVAPVGGNDFVPFTELAVLGGPWTLRGFRIGTFRDFSSLMGTAEYRWPLFMWADGTLFVDYGGVFGKWYQGIGAGQMQPDVGVGIRFHSSDRFFIRAQLAYGFGGTWQFYISGTNLP